MRAVIALALAGLIATASWAADDPESRVPASGTLRLAMPTLPQDLMLSIYVAPDKPLVTIRADGQVILGEGYTPDEAARGFWEQISRVHPAMCTARATATCTFAGRTWPARDGVCSMSDAPP